jgi:hypothetical protein
VRLAFHDGTGAIAMIDPVTEAHIGKDVKTGGGHPESFQLEKKGSRIFVNVPDDDNVVEVLDSKGGEMTKWELNAAKASFPMALDEHNHRLFIVIRRPPFLMVLDTETVKKVTRVPAAASRDDVYFDAERKRIYGIGGEGFISVFQQNNPDHCALTANILIAVGVPAAGLEPARKYGIMECRIRGDAE